MNPHFIPVPGKPGIRRFLTARNLPVLYLFMSMAWILWSNALVTRVCSDNQTLMRAVLDFKGIFFVVMSGALLLFITKKSYRSLAASYRKTENLEKKLAALNEAAREGIFDYDLRAQSARVNAVMHFFLPGQGAYIPDFWETFQRRIHPDDIRGICKAFHLLENSKKLTWRLEFRLLGSDDRYYDVLISVCVIRQSSGQPVRLIGTILDISELRRLQAEKFEEELKHKRELSASIIRAQEKERNRWAEELHDNVCQLLSVARLYVSETVKNPRKAEELLPEVKQLIGDALGDIRELSASIKPPCFRSLSLTESIEKLAGDIRRVRDLQFHFDWDRFDEAGLFEEQKLLVYRVVQEQLNNIVKYAGARNVTIALQKKNDQVITVIKDDGKGFDPSQKGTGIGLRNMESRLSVYQGRLQITSAPGKGCTVTACFDAAESSKPTVSEEPVV